MPFYFCSGSDGLNSFVPLLLGRRCKSMEETVVGNQATPSTKYKILDSFLLEPLFIIGVLVLTVVIVIIISHYLNRNETNDDEETNKTVAFTDTNLQTVTVLLDNIGDSIEMTTSIGLNEICSCDLPAITVHDEEGIASDKIMTIIPQKDFRDFPKTEEEQMKMRREIMLQMLALPPLT